MTTFSTDSRRNLPQLQRLLEGNVAQALAAQYGRDALVAALRAVLAQARARLAEGAGEAPDAASLLAEAGGRLAARARPGLVRAINATGIVLHTNLGRAPLAAEAVAAVSAVAGGYCNLEFDLETGRRGARAGGMERVACEVTGAEAALAVNNGAAAVLLVLSALAAGGEVVVSRGELVEIGGGFRVPEVIVQGGARLVEVGATNKTRLADYAAAIGPDTRVLLKVHQSNFRTIGFTAECSIATLAELARVQGMPVVADLGSGLIAPLPGSTEPTIADAIAAGADIVTCSGDKLLGGPQAGLILGRRDLVERIRRHPLMRALRLDKMSLAALEATLMLHRDRPQAVPVNAMLRTDPATTGARAERLRALVGAGEVSASEGFAGGGSLPEERIGSAALVLAPAMGAENAAAMLRAGAPAVVARVAEGLLWLDLLAVRDDEVEQLAGAVRECLP